MEIELKSSYYNHMIVVKDTNVNLENEISEIIYAKTEDGKTDPSRRLGYDITDSAMETYCSLLEDIAYFRQKEFDSSETILQLLDKLPEQSLKIVFKKLNSLIDE